MHATVIINADDFGWTDGQNMAVDRAAERGALDRASLICNGPGFDRAVAIAERHPGLRVGIHLSLNEGPPLLPASELPNLTHDDGRFHESLGTLVALWVRERLKTDEAMREWRAQIERALAAGIRVSHLDSHKHVHMLPPLLEAAVALAKEYDVPYLRLPLERPRRLAAWRTPGCIALWRLAERAKPLLDEAGLRYADNFVGIENSGEMTAAHLEPVLSQPKPGVTEIMMHPAVITPAVEALQKRYRWAARYRFADELDALNERAHAGA